MKVIIPRKEFLKSLSHQIYVLNKKTTIPILSYSFFDASGDDECKMIVTDLDSSSIQRLKCNILEQGKCTFPVKLVYDIVRQLQSNEDIILVLEKDSNLVIKAGVSKYKINILNHEDFPLPLDIKEDLLHDINREQFLLLLNRAHMFMCTNESRYTLNGMFFHNVDKNNIKYLRVVATDGHRLAMSDMKYDYDLGENIVLRKTLNEIRTLLNGSESEYVKIAFTKSEVIVAIDNSIIRSKLVDGNFPDYKKVIPNHGVNAARLKINALDLKNALSRVSVVSQENIIKLKYEGEEKLLLFSQDNKDGSFAEEYIDIQYHASSPSKFEISFNAQYLVDVINSSSLPEINININPANTQSASIITYENDDDLQYILMPMRA